MQHHRVLGGALFLFLCLLVLPGCGAAAAPSPQSHSSTPSLPTGQSGPLVYALYTQLIRSTPTELVSAVTGGKASWSFTLPATGSALTLQSGILYVGAGDALFALDAASGKKQWSVAVAARVTAIVARGGLLFVQTGIGGSAGQQALEVLNASDGSLRWRLTTPLGVSGWLIADDILFAVEAGFPAQFVAADITTGRVQWQKPLQSGVVSGEITAFLQVDASSLLLVSDQAIALLSRRSGAVIWEHQNTHNLGVQVFSGTLYAFYVDMPTAFGGSQNVGLRAVKASDGSVLWNQNLSNSDVSYLTFQKSLTTGAIESSGAYLVDGPSFGDVHAWNLSGQALWTDSNPGTYKGLATGGQALYLASAQGVTALDGATGKQRWRAASPDDITSLQATRDSIFGVNMPNTSLYALNPASGQLTWSFKVYQLHIYLPASV